MQEVQAPKRLPGTIFSKTRIFMGGSIEMGMAEKWQDRLKNDLKQYDIILLNPRRDDWDSTIEQRESEPRFAEQVHWELDNLEECDIIIFYFDPNTKSPITLMELGLFAKAEAFGQDIVVCCPDGFWRKGNVEVVCTRNAIKLTNSYDELLSHLIQLLRYADISLG
jgi:hypothetical protein